MSVLQAALDLAVVRIRKLEADNANQRARLIQRTAQRDNLRAQLDMVDAELINNQETKENH